MRIFRYPVPVDDQWHRITLQGTIVHVDTRDVRMVEIWATHRDNVLPNSRWVRVYATGQDIPDDLVYVSTCVAPEGLVWHLVENPHLDPGDPPAFAVAETTNRPKLTAA